MPNSQRNFQNWLRAYLDFTENNESPLAFHFWTGVSTIAGALRRRVWIDERYFDWTPNFYVILVGPPGVAAKSTTIRLGSELLKEVPGVHFGPTSMSWQGLMTAFESAHDQVTDPNAPPPDDPMESVVHSMSCITCSIGELGTFLRPEDDELVNFLIDMWEGQREIWKRVTKTQGNNAITNPCLNMIGCTTPSWLRKNVPENMVGGGLVSRIVFVYGDTKRNLVAYPSEHINSDQHEEKRKHLIEDLCQISEMFGEFKLTPTARAWGRAWYERHWTNRPIHMASERYGGYIARKQTHIHKLAIIISAAESNELTITESHLIAADRMITSLEVDMQKVFQSIGVSDTSKNVQEILVYLKAYKQLSQRELLKFVYQTMSQKDFKEALEIAASAGYIRHYMDGRVKMIRVTKEYLRKETEDRKAHQQQAESQRNQL